MLTLALALLAWIVASFMVVGALSLVLRGRARFNPEPAIATPVGGRQLAASSGLHARQAA